MSKEKIEELTDEQRARLAEFRDYGFRIGLSTERSDRKKAEAALSEAYKVGGLEPPKTFIWCQSPMAGNIISNLIENASVGDSVGASVWASVGDSVWASVRASVRASVKVFHDPWFYGSMDAHLIAFYAYFRDVLRIEGAHKLTPLTEHAENCGWTWAYQNLAIMSERPTEIHMAGTQLHNPNGPAVMYADGFSAYAINGVRFDWSVAHLIDTPAHEIDVKDVLAIKNVEQRAELIKKIGVEKALADLETTTLDTWEGYELLSVSIYPDMPRIYIKMQNPSIDEIHLEAVHPDCKTVQQALKWRNDGETSGPYEIPKILT